MRTRQLMMIAVVALGADTALGEPFKVQGAVEMNGLAGDIPPAEEWHNPLFPGESILGPTIGGQEVSFANVPQVNPPGTVFYGVYFVTGGVWSVASPGGNDGVVLFRAYFGEDYSIVNRVRILIRDGGADKNVEFLDIGGLGTVVGGGSLSQPYRLAQYDTGTRDLWVEAVPAPGGGALLAPMCLALARRRR
ncbi:MAG: hypothetical protein H6812_05120 [Phycisphaeraceae bacterium]|nr:hypothetical protein [Phycisphaerales bacterium]MCA9305352.1 hypothetical protein [Phycisphaerales bacterium]MCB9842621.1 hypothetical protein [Phycisphaeraceae bacterium]